MMSAQNETQGEAGRHRGRKMSGAEIFVRSLIEEKVEDVFGYPGGATIGVYDALHDISDVRHVLTRHEQGATHAAEGYAKATGRPGVVLVTSGPGATNTVTGIADAYMDSIPLVVFTGQVPLRLIGNDAFQEADIVGITLPIVKHSYLINDADDLPRALAEALHVAQTGRPGPVLVDVCVDQWAREVEDLDDPNPEMPGYHPPSGAGHPRVIAAAARALATAERPVIYAGGGIISGEASAQLTNLSEVTGIPVNTTLMGLGGFPGTHPLYVGMPGMHGIAAATYAFQASDVILAVGVRFDERVLSTVMSEWAPNAKIIHIDVDPAEISKNRAAHIGIAGHSGPALAALAEAYQALPESHDASRRAAWVDQIAAWKRQHPYQVADEPGVIQPQHVVQSVYKITRGDAIISTDVGQHQMWAAQYVRVQNPRSFISSGGLGTMGFGFPAAIGAQVGCPDKTVIVISGDGSFQMNIQELATARAYHIPVKIFIFNNGVLGMVRQWQEMFCNKRYSQTRFEFNPEFTKVAEGYGIPGLVVRTNEEVRSAIDKALSDPGPFLIDFRVAPEENVFPMVPAGKGICEIMEEC
jgi:acetolactate synthase-1/2/3 large subunit